MNILYKVYQLFIALPIIFVATVLTSLITILGGFINAHVFGYYPGRIWSKVVLRVLLLPIHVEGREHLQPRQSYVFVANHQGPVDIFLIYGYLGRNFKWMMKKALRKMPLVGVACEKARHIFVDKSGPKAIKETIDKARATLQNGTSLVVFPEGSRSFTGHMGLFRKGAFQLADDLQLPVVPVTIDGSFDVLTRMAGFNFVHWHPLRLVIHEPIPPVGEGKEDIKHTMEEAYRVIMNSLPERHQGYVKNEDQ
ncbi:MAG: lysophospholipid acyltransferase family protein [Bacteroidales bacterium]|nr:lysophospholipid acyltransferase family protein [Bacteroidales bacterium]MDD6537570.1 lysophospholipid acyltransferase family protein [Bacteroidales bacterium]MDD6554024.1 lysophospholipid acyltransferase family protein [Bacteroidales bacterium]MDD6775381.1 lysophospholipid acyltransferase family protein [Bacteroidales bacterium]